MCSKCFFQIIFEAHTILDKYQSATAHRKFIRTSGVSKNVFIPIFLGHGILWRRGFITPEFLAYMWIAKYSGSFSPHIWRCRGEEQLRKAILISPSQGKCKQNTLMKSCMEWREGVTSISHLLKTMCYMELQEFFDCRLLFFIVSH